MSNSWRRKLLVNKHIVYVTDSNTYKNHKPHRVGCQPQEQQLTANRSPAFIRGGRAGRANWIEVTPRRDGSAECHRLNQHKEKHLCRSCF